jgi:hypothetical protein
MRGFSNNAPEILTTHAVMKRPTLGQCSGSLMNQDLTKISASKHVLVNSCVFL